MRRNPNLKKPACLLLRCHSFGCEGKSKGIEAEDVEVWLAGISSEKERSAKRLFVHFVDLSCIYWYMRRRERTCYKFMVKQVYFSLINCLKKAAFSILSTDKYIMTNIILYKINYLRTNPLVHPRTHTCRVRYTEI